MHVRAVMLVWLALCMGAIAAQLPASGDAASGAQVFANSCSSCHGQGGGGGRAVALADSRRIRAMTDAEIATIIRIGAPNGMPPFPTLPPPTLDNLTAYLRSLNPAPVDASPVGDPARGAQLFFGAAKCAGCHLVGGRGAAIGPDNCFVR